MVSTSSEFNIIEDDFRMYRAFSGESIRARVEKMQNEFEFTWGVRVAGGSVTTEGELQFHDRAKGILDLTRRYAHELPDMLMWYNGHDGVRTTVQWEERRRLDDLVSMGEGTPMTVNSSGWSGC